MARNPARRSDRRLPAQVRRGVRLAASAALLLAASAAAGGETDVAGTWNGKVNDFSSAKYSVELRIWQNAGAATFSGTATYRELACSTDLKQVRQEQDILMFAEAPTADSRCTRRGLVAVSRTTKGRLQYVWTKRDSGQMAEAVLTPAAPPVARDGGTPPAAKAPVAAPTDQQLEARALQIAAELDALVERPYRQFSKHSDVTAALADIRRADPTAHAVANFAALMPRFVDSERVFELAASQAARRGYRNAEVSALNQEYQAAMRLMRQDWDSMVIAVALQSGWAQLTRLAQSAAGNADRDAADRMRKLLARAQSTAALRSLLTVSARHADLYRRIENEYHTMADGDTQSVAAQLRANDLLLVHGTLSPNDLEEAQAEVARLERWRSQYLADVNRGVLQSALGLLFGRDAGDERATREARASDAAFEAARREREERRAEAAARERERDELDRQRDRMYEPSPLLPPPQTIN